jgi:hypothetical protein
VKQLVMSTHKGRHMLEMLRYHMLLADHHHGEQSGRGLLHGDESGGGVEDIEVEGLSLVFNTISSNVDKDCFARNRVYT